MKPTQRILSLLLILMLVISSFSITAAAAEATIHGVGFVTASSLRLRSQADSSADTLALAPRNDCVVILGESGDWYHVSYNLQEGYMHKSYLTVSSRENAELGMGKVTGNSVNLRSGPATTYSVSHVSAKGETYNIVGVNNGWYKVQINNQFAYIRSDYMELTEIPYENADSAKSPKYYRLGKAITSAPTEEELAGNTTTEFTSPSSSAPVTGTQILEEARKYLGTRYVSGGASPAGFDCSGLVYYVLNQLGQSAYRTPVDQYKHGTYVDKANLKAGDIVFFAGTGASGISHVGIYAGNGQFIHAPNSRSTVSYSDLTSGYWSNHYYGARRIG